MRDELGCAPTRSAPCAMPAVASSRRTPLASLRGESSMEFPLPSKECVAGFVEMDAAHMPREDHAEIIGSPHPWILCTFSYSVVRRFSYSVFYVHSFGLSNLVILFIQYFCVYVDPIIQYMQVQYSFYKFIQQIDRISMIRPFSNI